MTSKERIIKTVNFEKTDRTPFVFPFGPWTETEALWHEQGLPPNAAFPYDVDADDGFNTIPYDYFTIGYCPAFEPELINDNGRTVIMRNEYGIVLEMMKESSTIPNYLEYPVKTPDDWKRLKEERLQVNLEKRLQVDWSVIEKFAASHKGITQIGIYPFGLFGTARDMLGVEDLLYWFYDEPDIVMDIMSTLTDLWIALYKQLAAHVQIDCVHMWEDMSGKGGPLISPSMMYEYMVPNYKKIKQFCVDYNVPIFSLDTDGDCTEIFKPLIDSGVNLIYPFEVAAGSDVAAIRKQYKNEFCMMGGIDKRALAFGEYEIDQELARIAPVIEMGGYIPALDHLFHPEIPYKNYIYFAKQMKKLVGKE